MISIHSLRMEGDAPSCSVVKRKNIFQSTPSAWRETSGTLHTAILARYFNPLPPHGGRQRERLSYNIDMQFQSTPSAWRETPRDSNRNLTGKFQSTPSAWRETKTFQSVYKATTDFNPLPPHGGRPLCPPQIWRTGHFNPLPPHGGRL